MAAAPMIGGLVMKKMRDRKQAKKTALRDPDASSLGM
jgi:hypothetical protein